MRTAARWIIDPAVRALTGLPLALTAIVLAATGHSAWAARLQIRAATRFPATSARPCPAPRRATGPPAVAVGEPDSPAAGRVVAHSALVLLPTALAFATVAMQLFLVYSGYLYPLRPDTIAAIGHPFTPDREVLPEAWGGPTLAGAWAVHLGVALALQALCGLLLVALCALQNRCIRLLKAPARPVSRSGGVRAE